MSFAVMAILLPLLAAPVLALAGQPASGARASLVLNILTFTLSTMVGAAPGLGVVHADGLGVVFGVLTGLVGVGAALANLLNLRNAAAGDARRWRSHHALGQAALGCTLLGLYADDLGLLWLALLGVGVVSVLRGGGPGATPAWHALLLLSFGMLVAAFATLLVVAAAQPVLGPAAADFGALDQAAAQLPGATMTLAFLLALLGYGTVLAPPRPVPAPLAGLAVLPANLVLVSILRFAHLAAAAHGGFPPGPFLLAAGLALLLGGGTAWRRHDIPRASALAQTGIVLFAFGIGGAAALFAGLLQMILRSLVEAGLRAAPRAGVAFGAGLFLLAGLPPSGLFVSLYLIVSQTVSRAPWLAVALVAGLLLHGAGLLRACRRGVWPRAVSRADILPGLHFLLTILLGYAMPRALLAALSAAAAALQ